MNISAETMKKVLEIFNQHDAKEIKNMMENVDKEKLLKLFAQINPSEAEIKKVEMQIETMTKEELVAEVIKKMKG